MSDPIFEYNKKVFHAIFGKANLPKNEEELRDAKFDSLAEDDNPDDDFDFERDCGARP